MMTSLPYQQRGISLIETMVTIAVIAIMLGVGVPSLSVWMKNNQIKTSAQNLLTGLQLARGEAVRQNSRILFQLTDTGKTGIPTWTVWSYSSQPCQTVIGAFPCPIQSSQSTEGGNLARIGVNADDISAAGYTYAVPTPAGTGMGVSPKPGVVFNAFGQVMNDNAANTIATRITRIDVTNATDSRVRRMVVRIPVGGSASMCDPLAKNTQGC